MRNPFFTSDKLTAASITCCLLAVLFFFATHTVKAETVQGDDLKAVYLYRFAHLVDWKGNVDTTKIRFCVTDENGVSIKLEEIVTQRAERATFVAIRPEGEQGALKSCHLIYTTTDDPVRIALMISTFPQALLIGEGKRFTAAGGMMAFIRVNNRIKPLINLQNLSKAPFSLRSQLLSIAVIDEEGAK